jgi:two-component system sensor histidine kinase GlrK
MTVSTRLSVGTGLVILLLLGALAYQMAQVRRLADIGRDLARTGLQASILAQEQLDDLGELQQAARKAFVTRDADYARAVTRLAAGAEKRQSELEALLVDPGAHHQAALLADLLGPLSEEARGLLGSVNEEGYLSQVEKARSQAALVVAGARRAMGLKAREAGRAADRAQRLSLLAALAAVAVSLAVLIMTARSIQRPLTQLAAATRAVAQGRFDQRLDTSGGDEFARVAEDFNVMVGRLGDLDRMKKDILSHVSHELKAPLAGMHETTELLLEELPGPLGAEQRRLLELNRESAARLREMIVKMLDLARLDAGAARVELRLMDLAPVVESAARGLGPLAGERGVTLTLQMPAGPFLVEGDADGLFRVVTNLLENAVKFSPSGGAVEVTGRRLQDGPRDIPPWAMGGLQSLPAGSALVVLDVADRGPGIPDGEKALIFERFHQVKGGSRLSAGGVGLGLAICRDIVASHGGALWPEDRPGGGSLFSVALRAANGALEDA